MAQLARRAGRGAHPDPDPAGYGQFTPGRRHPERAPVGPVLRMGPARPWPGADRCHRLFLWRMDGGGDGDGQCQPVPQDGAGGADGNQAAGGRTDGHLHGDAAHTLNLSFHDPETTPEYNSLYGGGERTPAQLEAFEDARTETARLAWEPILNNPTLPYFLQGVKGLPTQLIWGREDRVVPVSAATLIRTRWPTPSVRWRCSINAVIGPKSNNETSF